MQTSRLKLRIYGCVGVALVAALVGTSLAVYRHAFTSSVDVVVDGPRAGLLMQPGADVRVKGVRVGRVTKVELAGSGARLEISLDPTEAAAIPRGTTADVAPTTVFGAKYVELVLPATPGPAVSSGDVIEATHVTTEANDLFGRAQRVLTAVNPEALNQTLSSVATALTGRGDRIGRTVVALDRYLARLEPSTRDLQTDISRMPAVLRVYADAAPDIVALARSGQVTARTLVLLESRLRSLLISTAAFARIGVSTLAAIADPLRVGLQLARPVLSMLAYYSPEIPCTFSGFVRSSILSARVAGAEKPGIQGLVALLPGKAPYGYPQNLPRLLSGVGPHCYTLPGVWHMPIHERYFNDGAYIPPSQSAHEPPITVYTDLVRQWFGQAGVNLLLHPPGGTP